MERAPLPAGRDRHAGRSHVIALPPHTTLEQSKNFFEALAKGDPDRRPILRQVYRQMTL